MRLLITSKVLALVIIVLILHNWYSFRWFSLIQLRYNLSSSLLLFYLFLSLFGLLSLGNFSPEKIYKSSYFTLSRSTEFWVVLYILLTLPYLIFVLALRFYLILKFLLKYVSCFWSWWSFLMCWFSFWILS